MEERTHGKPLTDGLPSGLSDIIQQSDVPIVVADADRADMPLVLVNDAFCEMSGYLRNEMLGRNCRFLQAPNGVDPIKARIRAFFADDASQQSEFVIPNAKKDGSRFLNLLHLSKIRKDGHTSFILGSQFDITTRTTGELASYTAALLRDMRRVKDKLAAEGWVIEEPSATLTEKLDRIALFQLAG